MTTGKEKTNHGVNPGWTRESWIERLRYLADVCRQYNPRRADELTAWVDELEKGQPKRKDQSWMEH